MALILKDRVKESSSSSGTGNITLGGAFPGYQTFNTAIASGSTVYYTIHNLAAGFDTEWEVGVGTFTSPATLVRNTVLSSSTGSLINFTAGTEGLEVFVTQPAEEAVYINQATGLVEAFGNGTNSISFTTITANNAVLSNGTVSATPSNGTDITNKTYVDTIASSGLHYHQAVNYERPNTDGNLAGTYADGGTTPTWTDITNNKQVATGSAHGLNPGDVIVFGSTTNGITAGTGYFVKSTPTSTSITLTLTYDGAEITSLTNGTGLSITSRANSGVGATLTNSGANVALVIDGITVSNGNRILIYSQTNAYENGVYTVTNAGAPDSPGPGSAWVLTRAADADTYAPNSDNTLGQGDVFYVTGGNTGAGESYVMSTSGTIIFGTTNLTFNQISSAQVYSAGTGLNLANLTFSIANTAVTAATYGSDGNVAQFTVNAQGQLTNAANVAINASSITTGTLPNAQTTANSANGASTIVLRDTNGSFTANTITATDVNSTNVTATTGSFTNISGNAATVTAINASNISSGTIDNARTTANSSNSASTLVLRDTNGAFEAGNVTAANFIGAGTTITSINASNISSGTIDNSRTTAASANGASTIVLRDAGGNFSANMITADITGNGAALTAINASNITSGTINNARTTASSANGASTIVLRDVNGSFDANVVNATNLSGGGTSITSMNASNLSAGTVASARVSGSYTGITGVGTVTAGTWQGNVIATTYGGTNLSSFTANGVVYASSTSALATGSTFVFDGTNVGIGTSSPAYKLHVANYMGLGTQSSTGAGAGISMIPSSTLTNWLVGANYTISGAFEITPSTAGGGSTFSTPSFLINSSGNVGIGTSSPAQLLQVAQGTKATTASAISSGGFTTTDAAGSTFGLFFRQKTDATAANRWTGIQSFDNGVGASNLVLQDLGGNVGIGTSSPSVYGSNTQLIVKGTGSFAGLVGVSHNDDSVRGFFNTSGSAVNIGAATNSPVTVYTNNTERMRIDSSGNVGIGLTPSAWAGTASGCLQVGTAGAWTTFATGPEMDFGNNFYFNGSSWTYKNTGPAQMMQIGNSSVPYKFLYAGSGTANTAISWSESMRIDSSGNVGIGTSSPSAKLDVAGTGAFTGGGQSIYLNGSTNNRIEWNTNGIAAPSFTTRSNGTKLVLYPNLSGSSGDYALGIDSGILWSSVPGGGDAFRWYAGTTVIGTLTGGGALSVSGSCSASSFSGSGSGITSLGTSTSYQIGSLGVGTAASGTTGEIRATNNITAFYSDERLKTKTGDIENALDKVCQIETLLYHANETAVELGYDASIQEVGVTAQSVQKVQPEVVVPAPVDAKYLTVRYEKLVPLLIEAIKELKAEVDALKGK